MKKLIGIAASLCLIVGAFAGCGETTTTTDEGTDAAQSASTGTQTVSTDGSTSMEKVIGFLSEAYMEENQNVKVTYNPTGSGSGIQAVSEGRCDIGLSSRDLKDDEAETLDGTIVAIDGIAVIVNPENTVEDLTLDQIASLYKGEITNWSEVGGEDMPVVLIGREAASGTRDGFESITGTEDVCQYTQELTSTGDVVQTVSSNPNAIGYASLASVNDTVKTVKVEGVAPSTETIQDGSYKIQRDFLLVTKKDTALSDAAQKFFDYATSSAADEYIESAGAVPVKRSLSFMKKAFMKKAAAGTIEKFMNILFIICGFLAVAFVLLITGFLFASGIPAIGEIGIFDFLFGTKWASTAAEPSYGILPFILSSVYGTLGAIIIGVPIGLLCAVFLAKFANGKIGSAVSSAVDLLAGIPSVVYGLVGMIVIVPLVRETFGLPDGANLFSAIIVLAVMILPSVISVSQTSIRAVPREYEEASLALGATKTETVFKVTIPAAKSGILTSVVLGIGRAIGEAMAVMMVSGNVPNMPSIFKSVRFLTTAVASEMSYSSGLQRQALFSIALVLFVFIMLINLVLNLVVKKEKK